MPYGSVNSAGDWVNKAFIGPFISAYKQAKGYKDGIIPELKELSKTAGSLPQASFLLRCSREVIKDRRA
jgi:hypothetical protein